jgi:hypothetical protein
MNSLLKDWQIAQLMFGKNTKLECKTISELRKHGVMEPLCDGWYIITDKRKIDDCGYLISDECL